ncbi:transglycosylase SLT domain-containing protein [Edwardsiella tarda]|uniref:transglycosylase SLT domain-containing protein n=1 Tax=Edwardsiella tarda TaxID=636 RepID=UPI00098EFB5E|nr:transglycosylase SLT domain-containing protein [Edwardsiella tarda]WKS79882.1 transglycosylase SLT domain-containing protein [Edwardsiella tarda]
MKIRLGCLLAVLLLAGCAKQHTSTPAKVTLNQHSGGFLRDSADMDLADDSEFASYIRSAASTYNVDETLIKAIIQVESGGNPRAVSRSNAIGLMQLKASTAGRDAYRKKGRYGQPTTRELKDPAVNIDLGTAYLNILKNQQLAGITNPETMRYAMIVAYANGAGAMLRTFARDRDVAIAKINRMTPEQFCQYIRKKHPAAQAPRYLWKVNNAYLAMAR